MKHDFEALTRQALTEPRTLSTAYSAFWEYPISNQLLALMQLGKAEPIATWPRWKELGRHVKKGAKAIELIMPVFRTVKDETTKSEDEQDVMFFVARKDWFGLSATEGQDNIPLPIPGFDTDRMLAALNIKREPCKAISGNSMGYAKTGDRTVAVSQLGFDKHETLFHECAHILLDPGLSSIDGEDLSRDAREVEAELTAYLVKSTRGDIANLQYSRGYIQNWIDHSTFEKVRFPKVYAAVDTLLKAGRIAVH